MDDFWLLRQLQIIVLIFSNPIKVRERVQQCPRRIRAAGMDTLPEAVIYSRASSSADVFCTQRNLNNAFAYDLVPSVSVIAAALKAARRVNDFPTAVRVFEGSRSILPSFERFLKLSLPGLLLLENLGALHSYNLRSTS